MQNTSNHDYISVIDDLTDEVQKLKDKLRRHKQHRLDVLNKDKLFEIHVHALSNRKKRELEAILRDFATESPSKVTPKCNEVLSGYPYFSYLTTRPMGSARASLSTTAHSPRTSMGQPVMSSRIKSSEQKVESYSHDVTEDVPTLYAPTTDKGGRTLAIAHFPRSLSGKIDSYVRQSRFDTTIDSDSAPGSYLDTATNRLATCLLAGQPVTSAAEAHIIPRIPPEPPPPSLASPRESCILPRKRPYSSSKRSRSQRLTAHPGGDRAESGSYISSASRPNPLPAMPLSPERRAILVASANMERIGHLGPVPLQVLQEETADSHPDVDRWACLNLPCIEDPLHMADNTSGLFRTAMPDNAEFQLASNGGGIRLRGGTSGINLRSGGSNDYAGERMMVDIDNSDEERRPQHKVGHALRDEAQSRDPSENQLALQSRTVSLPEEFHYKPLFTYRGLSYRPTSADEMLSPFRHIRDHDLDDPRWVCSGFEIYNEREHHADGSTVYYSDVPFYADLSSDPGNISPTTRLLSVSESRHEFLGHSAVSAIRPPESGSLRDYRPLSDHKITYAEAPIQIRSGDSPSGLATGPSDASSEFDLSLGWSNEQQCTELHTLEPSGLGGVFPEDHFVIVATTERPTDHTVGARVFGPLWDAKTVNSTGNYLGSISTSPPNPGVPLSLGPVPVTRMEYVSEWITHLTPVTLPPAALFFAPFSGESSVDGSDGYSDASALS